MKVLTLDDSKTMLRIITNTFKRIGIEDVVAAEDGVQGMVTWRNSNGKFDLILTDWNMSNMNDLQFVQAIRKENNDIPIVMITTEGGKVEVITALKAGVNNYIVKPFTPQILKEKLESIVN